MNWSDFTEREKMVWAAAYAAGMTQSWTVESSIARADRAIKMLREYHPEPSTQAYR